MRKIMLATAALSLAAAAPALAQNNTNWSNTPAGPNSGYQSNGSSYSGQPGWHTQQYGSQQGQEQAHQALQRRIRQELSQAGFTDIKIMPESFLVHARDPQGNPFMMILNPSGMTAVTAAPGRGNSSYSQNENWNQSQNSRNGWQNGYSSNDANGGNWGPTGSSAMNNSGQSDNAINSPNGNGTYR